MRVSDGGMQRAALTRGLAARVAVRAGFLAGAWLAGPLVVAQTYTYSGTQNAMNVGQVGSNPTVEWNITGGYFGTSGARSQTYTQPSLIFTSVAQNNGWGEAVTRFSATTTVTGGGTFSTANAGLAQDFVFAGNMQAYTGNVSMADSGGASTTLGQTTSNIVQYGGETAGGNTALGTVTSDGTGNWINTVAGSGSITGNNVIFNYGTDASYDYVAVTNAIVQRDGIYFRGNADVLASGAISGTGFLQKGGTGTLTLTGSSSYSGGTTVATGTLQIGDGGTTGEIVGGVTIDAGATLAFNRSNDVTYSSVIGGAGSLAKSGAGSLTLSAANTYAGTTTVTAGTLVVGNQLALQNSTVAPAGIVFSNAVGGNAFSFGGLVGGDNLVLANDAGTPAAVTLTVGGNDEGTSYSGVLSGGGSLTKSGTGATVLTGLNTYTGATTVSSGTLQIGDGGTSGDVGSAGAGNAGNAVTVAGGATLRFDRSGTLDYKTTPRMRHVAGAGDIVVTGGVKLFNYTGGGTGFADANSWNNFSGRLIVTDGSEFQTIRNGATAMGTAEVILGDATTSGKLSQIEGNWTWTNNIALVGSANEILNNATGSGRSLKLQGVLSGSGNLALKDATGAMGNGNLGFILTGSSTLSGTLTVDTFVRVGGVGGNSTDVGGGTSGSLGPDAAVIINSGKRLTFSRTDSHTVANVLGGAGSVFIGSTGITGTATQDVTLANTNTYTGGTELLQGTLRVSQLSGLGSSSGGNTGYLAIKNGATFTYTGTGSETTTRNLFLDLGASRIDVTEATGSLTWNDASTKNGAFTKGGVGALALGGAFSGAASITVLDGTLALAGASTYSGPTTVSGGTLLVNGSLASTSGVSLASGGVLGGSGSMAATISGGGLVSPGNSPGITTAGAVDPTGGLGFAFEFTATGSPTYGTASASVNDVLRLTDATTPFVSSLSGGNLVDVYFDVATLGDGDTFKGGFYTDLQSDFLTGIENGTYAYWVKGNGTGTDRTFNGQGYFSLASFDPSLSVTLSTVAETAAFAGGTVNGQVTQFSVVPEPGTLALAVAGLGLAGWQVARRRRFC